MKTSYEKMNYSGVAVPGITIMSLQYKITLHQELRDQNEEGTVPDKAHKNNINLILSTLFERKQFLQIMIIKGAIWYPTKNCLKDPVAIDSKVNLGTKEWLLVQTTKTIQN